MIKLNGRDCYKMRAVVTDILEGSGVSTDPADDSGTSALLDKIDHYLEEKYYRATLRRRVCRAKRMKKLHHSRGYGRLPCGHIINKFK